MLKNRSVSARNFLLECGLDAFIFFDPLNIRYFCGFTGTDGVLAVTAGGNCFLTDSRYTAQARQQVAAGEIREYKVKLDGVLEYLRLQNVRKIGFEADFLPYGTVSKLRDKGAPEWEWVPVEQKADSLRGRKDEDEIEALLQAARLNAEAFEEILPLIRPGVREREIALALEFALKRRGGEEKAFDFIIASGPRGAMPHGIASDRELAAGELITIDFGTRVGGYHSDETVTVALGQIPDRLREVFVLVLEAHDRAMEAVRPGVPLKELDAVARDLIAGQGYGEYFGHGLGHGVGLAVHEFPTVSSRSEEMAEVGMVFTIEPGIYLPEVGGVRIEDMVQVTAEGHRRLTCISKEFRCLPVNS